MRFRHERLWPVNHTSFVKAEKPDKRPAHRAYVKKGNALLPVFGMWVRGSLYSNNVFSLGFLGDARREDGRLRSIMSELGIAYTSRPWSNMPLEGPIGVRSVLSEYDGVFSECGDPIPAVARQLLRDYVHAGGCLFTFCGGGQSLEGVFDDYMVPLQGGASGDFHIIDPALRNATGRETLTLATGGARGNLRVVGEGVTVLLARRPDGTDPVAAYFRHGAGLVFFSISHIVSDDDELLVRHVFSPFEIL